MADEEATPLVENGDGNGGCMAVLQQKRPKGVSYCIVATLVWLGLTIVWGYVGVCWIFTSASADVNEIIMFHTPHQADGRGVYEEDAKMQLKRLINEMRAVDDRVVYRAWYGNVVKDAVPENIPATLTNSVNFNILSERTYFIVFIRHPVDYAHNEFLTPYLPDKDFWLSRTAVDDAQLLNSQEAISERWKDKVWWNGLRAFQRPDAMDIEDFLDKLLPVNRDISHPVFLPRPYGRMQAYMTEIFAPQKYSPEKANRASNGFVMGPVEGTLFYGCNGDRGKNGETHAHGQNRVHRSCCGNFRLHGDEEDNHPGVKCCGLGDSLLSSESSYTEDSVGGVDSSASGSGSGEDSGEDSD